MVDLRDVVHGRHAIIQLAQSPEQLIDVHVPRPVHGGELLQNVFVVSDRASGRARAVVDQDPVGKKAAQHCLELMMVRVDEAGHNDAATRVDLRRASGLQVGSDREDLLSIDKHVGPRKVTDLWVQ